MGATHDDVTLEELFKEFPGVEIGSYPVIESKKFYAHLTFCSRNLESCGCAKEKLLSMISDEWLIPNADKPEK